VNEAAPFDLAAQPLQTGRFTSNLHPTSGRATIYRQPSGAFLLRLSDFHTSNGPDVHVVLAMSSDPTLQKGSEGNSRATIEVGVLKGNEGDQEYILPATVDLSRYSLVTIYCERFRVVFGSASLQPF
jgi:hypothetical protein